ncbi:HD domain-containing protein [Candidatus Woesearchaeota archaeon]|nr:HD domain-containing protein [Candidatus Woesearchaeota archaeon]
MSEKILNILKFLNEIEKLKSVTRHSWTSSGRQESVPEHSWRMAVFAMVLEKEFPEINMQRVMELSIVHDFGEIYDGDIPAFKPDPNKLEREEKAIKKLVQSLPAETQKKIIDLWKEYNECKTPESKLVKALDKLETLIQHNSVDIPTWAKIEKEFNLTYGKEFMNFHSFIKEFRKIVDKQTSEKIKNE